MYVIVFDVDGTLTDTVEVDARCFLQTFEEVCGFKDVDADWSRYTHATDVGIYREVYAARRGRLPTSAETERFREHLVGLFRAAAADRPFAPVRGAPELLAGLARRADYRIALATGCWADAARVKMAAAGMRYDDYPAASADDAADRESIIKLALGRACGPTDQSSPGAIYIGDGVWDVRACYKAAIPFLGIAVGAQKEKLAAAGAVHVLPDFSDQDRFLSCIEKIFAI